VSTGPSLYRRHRPRTFADVVGQEQVVRTLSNAVAREQVHHAYLFVGSRGTGKTSMAKILAACLNCEHGPTTEPCGKCDSCVAIARATSLDVIEMDAASNNSVDDIRDLRDKVAYAPVSGRHKVYILDEAHMLSSQAWNAFLKTLEEPPPRTIFVLATTEAQKVLPTVVDRCHRFDFGRPSAAQVGMVLERVAAQEGIGIEDGALALIARHATGSFRDALGTLEQLVTYAGDEPIVAADVLAVLGVADAEQLFDAVQAIIERDPAAGLRAAAQLAQSGRDPGQVLRDLEVHSRELLTVQVLGEVPVELRVTPERDQRLAVQAQSLSGRDVVRLLDLISAALEANANGAQPRIQLELVLIKAAAPEVDPSTAALLARIERLESALGGTDGLRSVDVPMAPAPAGLAAASPSSEQRHRSPAPGALSEQGHHSPAPEAPAEGKQGSRASEEPAREGLAVGAARVSASAAGGGAVVRSGAAAGGGAAPQTARKLQAPELVPALELDTVIAAWPAVIDLVRQGNAMLAALLADARPVAVGERGLTVVFPAGAAFLKRKAEQDDHRRAAAQALRAVTGIALALRYELRDVEDVQPALGVAVPSGEELVRRFIEEFDAEEIIDDPDQREAP
jgi:DNA polymerase III subunit gamma/tau